MSTSILFLFNQMATVSIDPATRLKDCPQTGTSIRVPSPITERLDQLGAIADEAGSPVNRQDLIAALILAAPETRDELFDLVVAYRRGTAADATVEGRDTGEILSFRRHKRGPRRRAG